MKNAAYLLVALAFFCVSSEAEEYSCKAEAAGEAYNLKVDITKGAISGVLYRSVSLDSAAATCELEFNKSDKTSYATWVKKRPLEWDVLIGTGGDGTANEEVEILQAGRTVHIKLKNSNNFEVHRMECGLAGSLSPTISISLDKRACILK